ncbi:MAG: hypothetical protein ABUL71_03230, partial [Gemmatimonadota bacterium]
MLDSLASLSRATLRVWQLDGSRWQLAAGPSAGADVPRAPSGHAHDAASWLALPGSPGFYLEIVPADGVHRDDIAPHVVPVVEGLLDAARSTQALTTELASRYEEIDLLYTIGELLGRANAVEEIASVILREVTAVVGARRAGLRIYDDGARVLSSVATLGTAPGVIPADVSVDEPEVVVARAFRSGRI